MAHFSESFENQLLDAYPQEIVGQITGDWQYANLPEQPGQQIPYVRLNKGAEIGPVLYVPGFSEGIINKAAFAAELATRNVDIILPGQNRTSILRDSENRRQATDSQARNYEAVLAAEGLADASSHFISHSYGSLVLESMLERAEKVCDGQYADSTAILLAPSGMGNDSIPKLARRWVSMVRSEQDKSTQSFPDLNGETAKASAKTLLANIPRTIGEVRSLAHDKLAVDKLIERTGQLIIMSYAQDAMYPTGLIENVAKDAVEAGATWTVPYYSEVQKDTGVYGGIGAVHDDEQFNPKRVASAALQFLS